MSNPLSRLEDVEETAQDSQNQHHIAQFHAGGPTDVTEGKLAAVRSGR